MFKKIVFLICILGLLIAPLTALAEGDNPRVRFKTPSNKGIDVYTFYDIKLSNLCYVTQDSIWCIPYHKLEANGRQQIIKLVNQAPKDLLDYPPDIIKIH